MKSSLDYKPLNFWPFKQRGKRKQGTEEKTHTCVQFKSDKQKPSCLVFSIYSFFPHIFLSLGTGRCYSKGTTEFISLVQTLIILLLPASIGKAERQHCCCLFSIGKKFSTINSLAPLSRKLVQHPNPSKSRKKYIQEYCSDRDMQDGETAVWKASV